MIRVVPSRWQGTVLVCGKCSRKLGGGFGADGRTALAKALRRALGWGKGRKAAGAVVETRCLKLCPKGRVVVVDPARPGDWLLVPPGTGADEVARALGQAPAGGADA